MKRPNNCIILSLLFLLIGILPLCAQPLTNAEVDELVEKTLKTFDVPGISVGIIKDGKIIHAKGYGVRSLNTGQKVDENTLFGIASNSKAYTAAALAMLVDEKRIKWDDKVTDYIPEFKMYNPYVTEEFTIRDLLTHRSGLGLGAGDLMMWPDSNIATKADIIHGLQYLKPVSSYRTKYDYNNNLYIIAGEVVARVSNMSWENFIEQRIMKPLGMTSSAASLSRLKNKNNLAAPHCFVDGKLQQITLGWSETANAAGGICSNITDLSKWVMMQLNNGKYGENHQLFSDAAQQEMWACQTILSVPKVTPYNTHFSCYGLGWGISDVRGFKQVSHTGGLAGIVTQVTLIPELNLGIIVLTNQQVGAAFTAITNNIKDGYLGMPKKDRITEYHDRVVKREAEAKHIVDSIWMKIMQEAMKAPGIERLKPTGVYNDLWFGDIIISEQNGKLHFESKKSPRLTGELYYYNSSTFVVKWNDRSLDADAFVVFSFDKTGKAIGMRMEAISPSTDFSFDFQDLEFKRKE
ncbi:MAG: serine hydrolase [Bacteroidota bacterium]|nr:serine hydrolase [Bacteroidota bacterium]